MEKPQSLIADKRFWECPVKVFSVASVFMIGVTFVVLLILLSQPRENASSGISSRYYCELHHG